MVHDTDGFNKRESGQIYALRRLNTAIDAHENGESFDVPSDYLDSYGDILEQAFDKQCDKALLTLANAKHYRLPKLHGYQPSGH